MTDESQNPTPAIAPTQVGDPLRGSAIATNQWWSSALTGPGTLNIWTQPLTVKVNHDKGIEIQAPMMEPLDVFASYWIASLSSLGTPSSTITVD